jgi:hypothetical protein
LTFPYDGKLIGEHIQDAMPRITGRSTSWTSAGGNQAEGALFHSDIVSASIWNGGSGRIGSINIDSSLVFPRYGPEVAVASVSVYVCITY